jgi:glycosyltransferase involved in cell wall biosynthesis
MNAKLSVIVPTRNEAANVPVLVDRVSLALDTSDWELLFVDDSDDTTPDVILRSADPHVRLLHRVGAARHDGLAGAVCDGFAVATGDVLAVMDGDLQHDPAMLTLLRAALDDADLVIASRYVVGDGSAGLDGTVRVWVSRASRALARRLLPRVAEVRDPLAGFFAVRRSVLDGADLRPTGYKILLELLVRGSWETVRELPYQMSERSNGQSNASLREGLRFGRHLARLRWSA